MENGGNPYNDHSNNSSSRPQINTANANPVWDLWCPNSSRFDWTNATAVSLSNAAASAPGETSASTHPEAASSQALMFTHHSLHNHHHFQQLTLYGGEGSHLAPDPHLMCLKLGKRHYFEDSFNFPLGEREVAGISDGKRGKHYYSTEVGSHVGPLSTATVPRCQVEGCHVSLVNAKDYHRRHKVCEMHSKAPKVIVLGLEQRFCQQCSRFHVVSEFDESKRSCRRRLAGHNERRRKSAQDSISRNSSHEKLIGGKFPCIASTTGHALSLLSLKASDSWTSSSDLSSRSSAALRELIAEHRAAILSRHVHYNSMEDHLGDQSQPSSNNIVSYQNQILPDPHNHWDRFQDSGMQAVTLDLMQAPASAFGFLPTRPKNKEEEEEEEECCELWNTWAGAQQV